MSKPRVALTISISLAATMTSCNSAGLAPEPAARSAEPRSVPVLPVELTWNDGPPGVIAFRVSITNTTEETLYIDPHQAINCLQRAVFMTDRFVPVSHPVTGPLRDSGYDRLSARQAVPPDGVYVRSMSVAVSEFVYFHQNARSHVDAEVRSSSNLVTYSIFSRLNWTTEAGLPAGWAVATGTGERTDDAAAGGADRQRTVPATTALRGG